MASHELGEGGAFWSIVVEGEVKERSERRERKRKRESERGREGEREE